MSTKTFYGSNDPHSGPRWIPGPIRMPGQAASTPPTCDRASRSSSDSYTDSSTTSRTLSHGPAGPEKIYVVLDHQHPVLNPEAKTLSWYQGAFSTWEGALTMVRRRVRMFPPKAVQDVEEFLLADDLDRVKRGDGEWRGMGYRYRTRMENEFAVWIVESAVCEDGVVDGVRPWFVLAAEGTEGVENEA